MPRYSRRDLVGTELESFLSRDDASGEYDLSQLSITDVDTFAPVERRYVSAHGEPVWAEVPELPIRDIHGNVDSAIVMLNDVTQRKDLEEQVLHAQKM